MTERNAGYVVVDVWRVKAGKEAETRQTLATAFERFSQVDGIVSVDYAEVDDHPDKILVIFRYRDRQAREDFVATDLLKNTMRELEKLWDLDDVFVKGAVIEFG